MRNCVNLFGKNYSEEIRERERERERVNSTVSEWRITGGLIAFLIAIIGICCYFGIQNSANASPQSVNFNAVTIRNGAKIHVNSNKSLTSIDNGNLLIADNTSGNKVKGDGIANAVSSFADSNYGSDALFSTNTANAGKLLSEAERSAFKSYLSTVTSEYWLSDTGSKGSITWQGYAKDDNSLANNSLNVTGEIDDIEYDDTTLVQGPYAFNKDALLKNYTARSGGYWGLSGTGNIELAAYYLSGNWNRDGRTVYNNPLCLDSGKDPISGREYKSSTVQNLDYGNGHLQKAYGYVSDDGTRIFGLRVGQEIKKGTTLVFGYLKADNEILDPSGFLIPNPYLGTGKGATMAYVGFSKTNYDFTVTALSYEREILYGLIKGYSQSTPITAVSVVSASKAVRPAYSLTTGNIAFLRPNTSNATLAVSSKFGDSPTSIVGNGENKKAVVKSQNTTIRSNISSSSYMSISGASGNVSYDSSNNTIYLPYGATSLTLDSDSFTTSNANYISALAKTNDESLKYATLGKTGSSLTLDLTSILNCTQVGSTATVSFYAEQTNSDNNTDLISTTPVTFNISNDAGSQQVISYDKAEGTNGSAPSNANVRSGQSYSLASGAGLSKNGYPFACWKVTYTKFGQTTLTTRYFNAGESMTVPGTSDGRITATAMYSGLMANKSTDSEVTVVSVSFDLNLPTNYDGKFDDDSSSKVTFNDEKTVRTEKVLINSGSTVFPSKPATVSNPAGDTLILQGWYTNKSYSGTRYVPGAKTPTISTKVTYYAKWSKDYIVTYDASGGSNASQSGKFSDKSIYYEESVSPGNSTKGVGSKGNPVANDDTGLYKFYGWYNKPNGEGGEFTTGTAYSTIGGHKTVYAYYGLADTFLAPKSDTLVADPRTIKGTKYGINKLKEDARKLANGTAGNSINNRYEGWLEQDNYHLYTRLKNKTGNNADDWMEFRIVHLGQHDNDGTGITFQAVHFYPTAYQMNSSNTNSGDWAGSAMYRKMQSGGEIYNSFDTNLTEAIYNVTKDSQGKLWLPTRAEITGDTANEIPTDNSRFMFWKNNTDNARDYLKIKGTRSGVKPSNYTNTYAGTYRGDGYWWLRSINTSQNRSDGFGYVDNTGYADNPNRKAADYSYGVVVCFSL